jgi:Bacterial Ig-like domain (group 1)
MPTGSARRWHPPSNTGRWGAPATLTLSPKTAVNPVDTEHCVTATVRDGAGNPTPGITVRFEVTGSVTDSGTDVTDANGQATFCYNGPPLPGVDAIHSYADTNTNGTQDAGEPFDDAEKTWALPVTTPGREIKITNGAGSSPRTATRPASAATPWRTPTATSPARRNTRITGPRSRSTCTGT